MPQGEIRKSVMGLIRIPRKMGRYQICSCENSRIIADMNEGVS
jgi:hypothetical protein